MLNSRAKISVGWSFLPIILLALVANVQPWGEEYVPIVLPVLICALGVAHFPLLLIWCLGFLCDLSLGMPLGFHSSVTLLAGILLSQLQTVSSSTVLLVSIVFSFLGILLLSFFGYALSLSFLFTALLTASIASAFAIWAY